MATSRAARGRIVSRAVARRQWQQTAQHDAIRNYAAIQRDSVQAEYQCNPHALVCVLPMAERIIVMCVDCGQPQRDTT